MRKRASSILVILSIMAVFTLAQSPAVISPALNSLAQFYSGIPYSTVLLLSTSISLAAIPCSTLAGAVAGKKISYRALTIAAMLCVLLGGILPFWVMDSFAAVLICRLMLGIGVGIASPLSSALIMRLLPQEKQAVWQGICSAVMNICGVLYQSVSGVICTFDVRYTWLVYGIVLLPLALVLLFLPEPDKENAAAKKAEKAKPQKTRLSAETFWTCVGFGVLFLLTAPLLLNISSILVREGLGTAATAGTILSAYSIGGMAAGFCFGKVFRLLQKKFIPVSLILQTLGLVLAAFSGNTALLALGTVIVGVTIHWIWPACIMEFSTLPSSEGTLASGLFISCMHLGNFLATPMIGAIAALGNDSPRLPVIAGCIGTAAVSALWMMLLRRKEQKRLSANT